MFPEFASFLSIQGLYGFASLLITYLLYWKGNFNKVRKTEHTIFTALGVTLPFVDAVETWIGLSLKGILTNHLNSASAYVAYLLIGAYRIKCLDVHSEPKREISRKSFRTD